MIDKLAQLAPAKKTDKNQAVFEYQSKRLIQCLISARIFVLKTLCETNPDLKPFTCRTIVQQQSINTAGEFDFPRSLFSFLTRTIIQDDFKNIWCGTQMRICIMDLTYSAAGLKPDNMLIFTDFNYLKSSDIFKLLSMCQRILTFKKFHSLFKVVQDFLFHFNKLIDSTDINDCYRGYIKEMMTKSGMYSPHSSFYCFWKDRIDRVIESIEKANSCPVKIKSVSEILVKLCISFLFGDGSSMSYSPELDLVQTGLVMVSKVIDGWHARMTEPIVLTAGLNYFADKKTSVLMDYFANQLFSPVKAPNLSRSERGHMMEYVIALRFIQGWWLQPELRKYLPRWAIDLNIKKPTGMVDCRTNESNVNRFVQQLRRTNFPHIVFPPANAGPDLRYSVFSCNIKTTSTRSSDSAIAINEIWFQKW
ncbi:hypothetical protein BATDEDRAFT_25721 [Batrachochytrium dendrobatidis JAM81]|uniref:Uncharacterized protein n=1 Tax=Batrachochytrium dendrobatidis (strain JAM81 / FGSC 10211) TaxID=684364 RepID=F4P5E5_BATDJ|nr:uncharacterized protein BATDEDRAFT_25721 [Batrachochytrium dendrobatidis JAM81]EGF79398.1 hypothetical protein BATDEDRAFT_25721 [Batrachochytrium dendrobatidis JAM81]|eukprot:XP_006679861.1 hypothetical protein BATDEDRAFT_25721 [Batrachochytrium dendrobatidis JAM81]